MKKITTLLLLCTVASSSALAQTKPVVNTGGEAYAKAYVVGSYNRGGFLAQSGENLKHIAHSTYTYWFLQNGTAEGSVQLINVRTGKGISVNAADGTFNLAGTTADLYVLGNKFNNYGLCISNANPISENSCIDARNDGDGCGKYDPRDNDWDGTTWVFNEAPGYFVSVAQGLVPVTTEQYHFDSKLITLPKATNRLRFRVLRTITNNNDGANDPSGLYPFFTMGEFYLYDADGNQVKLTADKFKTNAQEKAEGPISAICDGDKATHFHSSYNSTPNTYHYIEVTLPTAMQSFKFSFDARANKANVPAIIQVFDDEAIAKADVEDQVLQARPSLQSLYNSTNYSIGTNYQQYTFNGDESAYASYTSARTAANDVLQKYSGAVTLDEVNTAKTNLENAAADKFTINTPADGSYIRIRATSSAHAGMPFLTSDLSDVEGKTIRAALVSGANNAANSIFYYKDKKLIAYGTGYKATLDDVSLGYKGITDGTEVTFKAATEATSEYNVVYNTKKGKRKLYTNVSGSKYYTDAWSVDGNHNRCRFWLEKVQSLPVSVSAAGYATLYAPVALTIPENVQAYTASFADNKVTLTPIESTIPANTGVVIEAAEGTYNFAITTTDATAKSDLTGNVATANVDAASAAYILGKTDAQGVGFFKLNSTDRAIKGGRAYYVATNGGAAAAYLFNGNVTGLEAIKTALNDANAPIYDLSGRKVAKAVKGGLYIKNGQKFIVK